MPTPSAEIIQLLSIFAVAFTAPTFAKVLVLIYGTILAPGRRTVTAALRAMGLALFGFPGPVAQNQPQTGQTPPDRGRVDLLFA